MYLQSDFQIALNWLLNWKNDNVAGHAPPPRGLKISEKSLLGGRGSEIFIWVGGLYCWGGVNLKLHNTSKKTYILQRYACACWKQPCVKNVEAAISSQSWGE